MANATNEAQVDGSQKTQLVDAAGNPVGGTSAAPADAKTNAASTSGLTQAFLSAFNGTTWDRVRAGITTVGNAVTGFLNAIPWAFYNATPTTRTNGQGGALETDAVGRLRITTFPPLPTFSFAVHMSTPIVENDPNTTAPAANRIATFDPATRGPTLSATPKVIVVGGTALTYQPWIYDTATATWLKWGTTITITVGTSNLGQTSVSLITYLGVKFFAQVTAQTGNPTDLYYDLG